MNHCKAHIHVESLKTVYRYYVPTDFFPPEVKPSIVWLRGYESSTRFKAPMYVQDAGGTVIGYVQFTRELSPGEVSKYGLLPSLYGWSGYIGDDGMPLMPDKRLHELVTAKQRAEDAERQFGTRDVMAAVSRANRALRDYATECGYDPGKFGV